MDFKFLKKFFTISIRNEQSYTNLILPIIILSCMSLSIYTTILLYIQIIIFFLDIILVEDESNIKDIYISTSFKPLYHVFIIKFSLETMYIIVFSIIFIILTEKIHPYFFILNALFNLFLKFIRKQNIMSTAIKKDQKFNMIKKIQLKKLCQKKYLFWNREVLMYMIVPMLINILLKLDIRNFLIQHTENFIPLRIDDIKYSKILHVNNILFEISFILFLMKVFPFNVKKTKNGDLCVDDIRYLKLYTNIFLFIFDFIVYLSLNVIFSYFYINTLH